jgi:hypothetical protein
LQGQTANGDDINVHTQEQGTLRFPVQIVATPFAVRASGLCVVNAHCVVLDGGAGEGQVRM